MGIQTFGLPLQAASWLANLLNLDTFVEAGTYMGDSAIAVSTLFTKVITIERDPVVYDASQKRLSSHPNITAFLGCTRNHIVNHLSSSDRVLFWLDAHWTFGINNQQFDECPILDELALIQNATLENFVILIDDARLFLSPPPKPHSWKEWPRIDQLIAAVENSNSVFIYKDVIYIIPLVYAEAFSEYLQSLITHELFNPPLPKSRSWRKILPSRLPRIFGPNRKS